MVLLLKNKPRFGFLILLCDTAKACNMPKERIQKAIESGSGVQQGEMAQEITFEGTGPKGSAVIVQCLTLSRNRIVQSLRHAMDKNGGALATENAVKWMFDRHGVLKFIVPSAKVDELMDVSERISKLCSMVVLFTLHMCCTEKQNIH